MYKRVLIKLSGEALAPTDSNDGIFDADKLECVCKELITAHNCGTQIAVVIGAGNIWRGRNNIGFSKGEADSMGMLATIINSIAVRSTIERLGSHAKLFTSVTIPSIAETFNSVKGNKALDDGNIVIIGGGTGNPFFTTDTAAVLRALELNCDASFFAKDIDAVYNRDPHGNSDITLKRFRKMNFDSILVNGLKVIDLSAAAMCKEKNMDVVLFALNGQAKITEILSGDKEPGTIISNKIINNILEDVE